MDALLTLLSEAMGPLLSALLALVLNPTVIIAALAIGAIGEVVKRLVRAKEGDTGWRGVFYVTLPAHAVVAGMLIGLIPWLPPIDALVKEGYEAAGRFGTYTLAGIVCKLGYDSFISTSRRIWDMIGERFMSLVRSRLPTESKAVEPEEK